MRSSWEKLDVIHSVKRGGCFYELGIYSKSHRVEVFGITVANWFLAVTAVLVTFLVVRAGIGFIVKNLRRRTEKTGIKC